MFFFLTRWQLFAAFVLLENGTVHVTCPFLPAGLPCPAKEVKQLALAIASDLNALDDCAGQEGAAGDEHVRLLEQRNWLLERFPDLARLAHSSILARGARSGSGDSSGGVGKGDHDLAAQFRKLDFEESGFGSDDQKSTNAPNRYGHDYDATSKGEGGFGDINDDGDSDEGNIWYSSSSGGDGEVEAAFLTVQPLSVPGHSCGTSSSSLGQQSAPSGISNAKSKKPQGVGALSEVGSAGAAQALCVVTASPAYRNASLAGFPLLAVAYAEGAVEIRLVAAEIAPSFFEEEFPETVNEAEGYGRSYSSYGGVGGGVGGGGSSGRSGTNGLPPMSRAMTSYQSPKPPSYSPPPPRMVRNISAPASFAASLQTTGYFAAQLPLWRALYNDAAQSFFKPAGNSAAAAATSGGGTNRRPLTSLELARTLAWSPSPILFARSRDALGLGTKKASTSSATGPIRRKSVLLHTGASASVAAGMSAPSELERTALELELLGALSSSSVSSTSVGAHQSVQRGADDPLDFATFADGLARHAQVRVRE